MVSKRDLKQRVKELKVIERFQEQNQNLETSLTRPEIREIKRLNRHPHGNKFVKSSPGMAIEVKNVSRAYVTGSQKFEALKNVSFAIKKGEFVVILGTSGSGKTTLLNLMSGLDRCTTGDIVISDINIAALKNGELTTFRRNNLSFIFQSYNLLPELNVRDNIEIGRVLQIDGSKRGDTTEILKRFDMSQKINSPVNQLSGGQSQRVSIARALAKNPAIIFADEPTGSLDSKTSEHVLELFFQINRASKTTIIFVTHNESIARRADRVLRVKDGEVMFE